MHSDISNHAEEGKRVWSLKEVRGFLPETKKRIHVPANTGGTIDYTFWTGPCGTGKARVVIRWNSTQETDSGFSNIVCIHPFRTLEEFLDAAQDALTAELFYDAKGDFQEFRIEVPFANEPFSDEPFVTLAFDQDRHPFFRDFIMPRLKLGDVRITETGPKDREN